MAKIVVMSGDSVVSTCPLDKDELLIGRGTDCTVPLDDPSVSRHHARVLRVHTAYLIEDLNSTNGLLHNGLKVRKRLLKEGDVVRIGSHELRFTESSDPAEPGDHQSGLASTVALTPSAIRRLEQHYAPHRSATQPSRLFRWLQSLSRLFKPRDKPPL